MQVSEIQEKYLLVVFKNNLLNEKPKEIGKSSEKGKSEGSSIQFKLEEKLINS